MLFLLNSLSYGKGLFAFPHHDRIYNLKLTPHPKVAHVVTKPEKTINLSTQEDSCNYSNKRIFTIIIYSAMVRIRPLPPN